MKQLKTHRANKKADDMPRSATFQPGKKMIPENHTFSKSSKRKA